MNNPAPRHRATLLRIGAITLAALAVIPAAHADECEPEWSSEFLGYPGMTGLAENEHGVVYVTEVLNDGTGEALYVAGEFSIAYTIQATNIAKWDGSEWEALGSGVEHLGGLNPLAIHAMTMFDDGNGPVLYVAGFFDTAGGMSVSNIAKWDGASWSSVGDGLDDRVYALAVHDDGSGPALYAAGGFDNAGSLFVNNIAKWDGTKWSAITHSGGVGLDSNVRSLISSDHTGDSHLYAGGLFSPGGSEQNKVQRWDGSDWSDYGSTLPMAVQVMAISEHVDPPVLCVAGNDAPTSGHDVEVRYWSGSTWTPLGDAENVAMYGAHDLKCLDLGSGPVLYIVGWHDRLLRWNGSYWEPVPTDQPNTHEFQSINVFDSGDGPELILAGSKSDTIWKGLPAEALVKLTGSTYFPLTETKGLSGSVEAIAGYDHGSPEETVIYVGGTQIEYAGTTSFENIGYHRDGQWYGFSPTPELRALDLCYFEDGSGSGPVLHAGGERAFSGDLDVNGIGKWHSMVWSSLGTGFNGRIEALAVHDDGAGPALYSGGWFRETTTPGGETLKVNAIAKWNGTEWSKLRFGIRRDSGIAKVLALSSMQTPNGPALYAAGDFDTASGISTPNIAEWRNNRWHPLGSGIAGIVYALAAYDDGSGPALYAAGVFTDAGGVSVSNIAKWDGTNWSAFGENFSNLGITVLQVFDDGSGPALYAGGTFDPGEGHPVAYLAKWDGMSWSTVDPTFNGEISDLYVIDRGPGQPQTLLISGAFRIANGQVSPHIAALEGCPTSFIIPCPGDINNDNTVDLADFNVLGINFGIGPGATLAQGDLNEDGYVDLADFNILGINFGNTCP